MSHGYIGTICLLTAYAMTTYIFSLPSLSRMMQEIHDGLC